MQTLSGIIAIFLAFVIVVGFHELGHALAAFLFKIRIKRISLGFGKPLLRFKSKKKTEWVLALWPMGGYVQLYNSRIESVEPNMLANCFDKKPIWQRVLVLVSGVLVNFIVAWIAFVVVFMAGYQQTKPVIANIRTPSVASSAHLKAGDQLLRINHVNTPSWQKIGMELVRQLGQSEVFLLVKNNEGQNRMVQMDLSSWRHQRVGQSLLYEFGIEPNIEKKYRENVPGVSFYRALRMAFFEVTQWMIYFFLVLKLLMTGMLPFSLFLGPLSLFAQLWGTFLQGVVVFLTFVGQLSLAVGLINALPIPGLDGGSLLYLLIEKVRSKPISIAWEILLHRMALIGFSIILVQLLLNDLRRYFIS